jgi:hypothetical protein
MNAKSRIWWIVPIEAVVFVVCGVWAADAVYDASWGWFTVYFILYLLNGFCLIMEIRSFRRQRR